MDILFMQLSDDVEISIIKQITLETGFVVQGHICTFVTRLYEATWLNVMYLKK